MRWVLKQVAKKTARYGRACREGIPTHGPRKFDFVDNVLCKIST
jgi:hypothetical protein